MLVAGLVAAAGAERPLIFGVNHVGGEGQVGDPPGYRDVLWERMGRAGVTCSRIAASWREIEREPGRWDWSTIDEEAERADRWGITLIPLIVNTPGWASPTGEPTHAWPPREDCAAEYEEFVRRLVRRMKGRTRYYEFWNEQNGWGWHTDGVKYSFVEEYIPWLRRTYRVIKEEQPDAVVALGGMDNAGGYAPIFLRLTYVYRDMWYPGEELFDAVADHPYSHDAATMKAKIDALVEVMRANGDGGKPIWITEMGWHTAEISEDEQADRYREVLEALASPAWSQVTVATYLCVADFENRLGGFGLTDPNLRPKPAYGMFAAFPKPPRALPLPAPPEGGYGGINIGFEDGFRAGIARGWTIAGRDFCLDGGSAGPEAVRSGARSQVIRVPRGASRGVDSVMEQPARAALPLTVGVWARVLEHDAPGATVCVGFLGADGSRVDGEAVELGVEWRHAACRWPGGSAAPRIRIVVGSGKPDGDSPVSVALDDVEYLVEE